MTTKGDDVSELTNYLRRRTASEEENQAAELIEKLQAEADDFSRAYGLLAAENAALSTAFSDDQANAVRAHAAVLPLFIAAPSPAAVGDEKLTVWYGSLPESNGKSNWTAILHRGDITEGITIEISEYPGRARYEADRMRYMIGELTTKPDILDYDTETHSGYKPAPAPAGVPDWVTELKQELLMSKMTHNFTFTRDEVVELLSLTSPAPHEYEEVGEQHKWQPIETAPKDESEILISGFLFNSGKQGRFVAEASWSSDSNRWIGHTEDTHFYPPTHWMPLPNPPSDKEQPQ